MVTDRHQTVIDDNGNFCSWYRISAQNWAELNSLELNLKNSKVMLLGSEACIASNILTISNLPPIIINNNPLPHVNLIKNLGLWITSTLDWKAHVEHILEKVHSSLDSLHFYRKSLSFSFKKQLILSLVLSLFDYASIAFIDLDKTRISQLHTYWENYCQTF